VKDLSQHVRNAFATNFSNYTNMNITCFWTLKWKMDMVVVLIAGLEEEL
jgi:hypothetical protein